MAKLSGIILAAALAVGLTATMSASADSVKFVLKEYNGKVALFCNSENEPAAVYQTSISSFYPADRELLEKGIILNSREELRQLIEDMDLE